MLINNHKHLYDIKNFNNYKNVYVVRANDTKIDSVTHELLNDGNLRHKYNVIRHELILFFAIDDDINVRGFYKIIYGHFYNNSNNFLYKKIHDNKIINLEVFRCNERDLLHNELNKYLIYSDSYNDINRQIINISKEKVYEIKSHFIKPFDLSYDSENLSITSNSNANVSFSYENECIYINKKKIN